MVASENMMSVGAQHALQDMVELEMYHRFPIPRGTLAHAPPSQQEAAPSQETVQ